MLVRDDATISPAYIFQGVCTMRPDVLNSIETQGRMVASCGNVWHLFAIQRLTILPAPE